MKKNNKCIPVTICIIEDDTDCCFYENGDNRCKHTEYNTSLMQFMCNSPWAISDCREHGEGTRRGGTKEKNILAKNEELRKENEQLEKENKNLKEAIAGRRSLVPNISYAKGDGK